MSHRQVAVYYNGQLLEPNPTFTYTLTPIYNNDIIISYEYNITLNGYCIRYNRVTPSEDEDETSTDANFNDAIYWARYIKNVFASNGAVFKIVLLDEDDNETPIFYATDTIVKSISFPENDNFWTSYINYTIELKSNHVFVGESLNNSENSILLGDEKFSLTDNLSSPFTADIRNHKIKSFSENFNLDPGDNISTRTTIFNNQNIATTALGGEFFNITYTVSAVGKHDVYDPGGGKNTLPAWEHAKRFAHTRLLQRMGGVFATFLSLNNNVPLNLIGTQNGPGVFSTIEQPQFNIYNEHFSFSVGEAEGSFEITYNAIIKRNCLLGLQGPVVTLGCSDQTIHTVNKQVNHSYGANEQINAFNREIQIDINGTIRGLVPGGIFRSQSRLKINDFPTGSFLVYNTTFDQFGNGALGGMDKNYYANLLMNQIFDYNKYDLTQQFKTLLGVTPENLSVSPTATLKPTKMVITRDYLNGTINYNATYDNKFNCDPNNFEIQLSIEEPNPVIAEFTVPNNNYNSTVDNSICPEGKGYTVIQLLGTQTAKKIDVTINGNISLDFNRCCLGTTDNWNLFDYDYLRLQSFAIPSGVNIPELGPNYVLTRKTKTLSYPKGELSINLSYICADVCDFNTYFDDKPII